MRLRAGDLGAVLKLLTLWSTLRIAGNSPAVRLTITIPAIGYLLLLNEKLVEFTTLLGDSWARPGRLVVMYFALVSLAVGQAIYAVACPPEIKDHPSVTRYIANDFNSITESTRSEIIAWLIRSGAKTKLDQMNYDRALDGAVDGEARERAERRYWSNMYDLYYRLRDESRPKSRFSVSIAYSIGFLTLFGLSADVFVRVFRYSLGL